MHILVRAHITRARIQEVCANYLQPSAEKDLSSEYTTL